MARPRPVPVAGTYPIDTGMAELAPVANVVQFGYALFVNRDLPVQNFADLVAYGRAHPDQLNYGTGVLTEYGVAVQSASFERGAAAGLVNAPPLAGEDANGGGRVTELVARPLLAALRPELGGVLQPLGGEYAASRDLLTSVPFAPGYGVEIGARVLPAAPQMGVQARLLTDAIELKPGSSPTFSSGRAGIYASNSDNLLYTTDGAGLTLKLHAAQSLRTSASCAGEIGAGTSSAAPGAWGPRAQTMR